MAVLSAFTLNAAELSGSLSTALTLGSSLATQNSLALRLSFYGFELQSLSIWQNLTMAQQTLTARGDFGNLGIQIGLVLQPLSTPRWGTWSTQEFEVVASFVSFKLVLGQIRFTLTLHAENQGP